MRTVKWWIVGLVALFGVGAYRLWMHEHESVRTEAGAIRPDPASPTGAGGPRYRWRSGMEYRYSVEMVSQGMAGNVEPGTNAARGLSVVSRLTGTWILRAYRANEGEEAVLGCRLEDVDLQIRLDGELVDPGEKGGGQEVFVRLSNRGRAPWMGSLEPVGPVLANIWLDLLDSGLPGLREGSGLEWESESVDSYGRHRSRWRYDPTDRRLERIGKTYLRQAAGGILGGVLAGQGEPAEVRGRFRVAEDSGVVEEGEETQIARIGGELVGGKNERSIRLRLRERREFGERDGLLGRSSRGAFGDWGALLAACRPLGESGSEPADVRRDAAPAAVWSRDLVGRLLDRVVDGSRPNVDIAKDFLELVKFVQTGEGAIETIREMLGSDGLTEAAKVALLDALAGSDKKEAEDVVAEVVRHGADGLAGRALVSAMNIKQPGEAILEATQDALSGTRGDGVRRFAMTTAGALVAKLEAGSPHIEGLLTALRSSGAAVTAPEDRSAFYLGLGNSHRAEVLPDLLEGLNHGEDELARRSILMSLGRVPSVGAVEQLLELSQQNDLSEANRQLILRSLASQEESGTLPETHQGLVESVMVNELERRSGSWESRLAALDFYSPDSGRPRSEKSIKLLKHVALSDEHPAVRERAQVFLKGFEVRAKR